MKAILQIIKDLFKNRRLIWELSVNDFKTKYAGSILGIVWAFVQPIMTILIFWFVFQVGLRSTSVGDIPFICWLATGLIPWFFFSEAVLNGTNSFIEYSYLVKKMVFKTSMLPIIKIISSLFVHIILVLLLIVIYMYYGYMPNVFTLQLIYYSFCAMALVIAISFVTASIIPFLKDMGNMVSIALQFLMWLTPIMWPFTIITGNTTYLFKLNPVFYIVQGYRDSLIDHVWFWTNYKLTIYFWCVTLGLFLLGAVLYKRLRPHFADVL